MKRRQPDIVIQLSYSLYISKRETLETEATQKQPPLSKVKTCYLRDWFR